MERPSTCSCTAESAWPGAAAGLLGFPRDWWEVLLLGVKSVMAQCDIRGRVDVRQELELGPTLIVWEIHSCLRQAFATKGLSNGVAGYRDGSHTARVSMLQSPP